MVPAMAIIVTWREESSRLRRPSDFGATPASVSALELMMGVRGNVRSPDPNLAGHVYSDDGVELRDRAQINNVRWCSDGIPIRASLVARLCKPECGITVTIILDR